MSLTKEEILEETIEYIKKDGRAVNEEGRCVYSPKRYNEDSDHDGCAVGRCIDKRKYKKKFECIGVDAFEEQLDVELDNLLKEKYKGHKLRFWSRLQRLHDSKSSWKVANTDDYLLELSENGKERVERIKEEFITANKSF